MIAAWMLYCAAVSALLAGSALALERMLHAFGRPTRRVWAGAMVLSVLLPAALPALHELRAPPEGATVGIGALQAGAAAPEPGAGMPAAVLLDSLLAPAWALATLLLLAGLGASLAVLRLRRRGWRAAVVAGTPVLVSPRMGPAVAGFLPGRIVLPAWALEWDTERQRMMVEHEREHIHARDPLLYLAALTAAVLFPWNAALWWQLRRLRLAVEVDCDARVLRRRADPREYGLLLLEVGRVASGARVPVVALTEPPSFLERRIRMMASPKLERRLRRAGLSAGICAGALALAAAVPLPELPAWDLPAIAPGQPAPADTIPLRQGVIDVQEATDKPRLVNRTEVAGLLREKYPPLLRSAGITGSAVVKMVIDREGSVAEAGFLDATRPEFGEAAVAVMRQARFVPARREGQPVAVRVAMPVRFITDTSDGTGPAPVAGVGEETVGAAELDTRPTLLNADEVAGIMKEGYPPLLRSAGITGTVTVSLAVTAEGTVSDARVVEASRPEFSEPALRAMRAARFTPAEREGKKVPARVTVPVSFSLDREAPAQTPAAVREGGE